MNAHRLLLLAGVAWLGACQSDASPEVLPAAEAATAPVSARAKAEPAARVASLAARANARLAAAHSRYRVADAWFFTVGWGVPPFRSLKFGARWIQPDLTYVIDESRYPAGLPAGDVTAALTTARETWNGIANINATRVPAPNRNFVALDEIIRDANGDCVDIFDPAWTGPAADVAQGGWLPPAYFEDCLGSSDIIAVTWTFFGVDAQDNLTDANGDNFYDIVYSEQFFNDGLDFVTTGSQYLDFDGPFDIQSIAVHEDGHVLGLDHTGGPNDNQPFKLHPNGRVFSPEAVMNPFSLGGEKRNLLPLDVAALRSLYQRR